MDAEAKKRIYRLLIDKIEDQVARRLGEELKRTGLSLPRPAQAPGAKTLSPAADQASCSEPSCDRPARAKGLCSMHYQRQRYQDKKQTL